MVALRLLLAVSPAILVPGAWQAAEGSSPGPAGAPSQGAPAGLACGSQVEGLGRLLVDGGLLLFGEIHGTREEPEAFGEAVCHAASGGGRIRVGLELPVDEAGGLRAILTAGEAPAARRLIESMPFFQRDYQDGRSSRAMAELLLRLRRLRSEGRDVEVVPFDPGASPSRDREMAAALAEDRRAHPGALLLVLTGNLHASKSVGTPWDPALVPMGKHLLDAGLAPVSLRFSEAGGTAWICTGGSASDCGERSLGGQDRGAAPFLSLAGEGRPDGYDGILYMGRVTASSPATAAP